MVGPSHCMALGALHIGGGTKTQMRSSFPRFDLDVFFFGTAIFSPYLKWSLISFNTAKRGSI